MGLGLLTDPFVSESPLSLEDRCLLLEEDFKPRSKELLEVSLWSAIVPPSPKASRSMHLASVESSTPLTLSSRLLLMANARGRAARLITI